MLHSVWPRSTKTNKSSRIFLSATCSVYTGCVSLCLHVWMCLAKVNHGMYFGNKTTCRLRFVRHDIDAFFSHITRFATSQLLIGLKVWHVSPNGECKLKFLSKSSWLKTKKTYKTMPGFLTVVNLWCVFYCFCFRHPENHVFNLVNPSIWMWKIWVRFPSGKTSMSSLAIFSLFNSSNLIMMSSWRRRRRINCTWIESIISKEGRPRFTASLIDFPPIASTLCLMDWYGWYLLVDLVVAWHCKTWCAWCSSEPGDGCFNNRASSFSCNSKLCSRDSYGLKTCLVTRRFAMSLPAF